LLRVFDAGEYESLESLRESMGWDFWMEVGPIDEVREIISQVKKGGDDALIELTARFDGVDLKGKGLRVNREAIGDAARQVDPSFVDAAKKAIKTINAFHKQQLWESQFWESEEGARIGQIVRPLERVGVYIPGGSYAYPSTAMMTVIPAKVAGVHEIAVCVPPGANGEVSPHTLFVMDLLGVEEIYRLGGAQAVAAMALGTETVKPVQKIVGPGNIYVTLAKKELFGRVGIDMLAGPTELVVLAEGEADPECIALDMLAQLEHGSGARVCLITSSDEMLRKVDDLLDRMTKQRGNQIEQNAYAVLVEEMETGVKLVDVLAPEHLLIATSDVTGMLSKVHNAGAIFLGVESPVSLGDYAVGVNHVLPTAGCSRFSSPLGVYDFLKRSNVVFSNAKTNRSLEPVVDALAQVEGMFYHGNSLRKRLH